MVHTERRSPVAHGCVLPHANLDANLDANPIFSKKKLVLAITPPIMDGFPIVAGYLSADLTTTVERSTILPTIH